MTSRYGRGVILLFVALTAAVAVLSMWQQNSVETVTAYKFHLFRGTALDVEKEGSTILQKPTVPSSSPIPRTVSSTTTTPTTAGPKKRQRRRLPGGMDMDPAQSGMLILGAIILLILLCCCRGMLCDLLACVCLYEVRFVHNCRTTIHTLEQPNQQTSQLYTIFLFFYCLQICCDDGAVGGFDLMPL